MPGPIDVEVEPRAGPSTNRPGCTFRWVNARRTKRKSLVALLAKAATPLLIEHLAESWPGYNVLMAQHGSLAVEAVHNESVTSFFMSYAANTYSLAEYDGLLRRGAPSVDATYVFSDVSRTVYETHRELSQFFGNVSRRMYADFRAASVPLAAARGTLGLLVGGPGTGNDHHAHGNALIYLLAGRKQWEVVHRTNGSKVWWCEQRPGDLVWVPWGFSHHTLNGFDRDGVDPAAPSTVALSALFNLPRPTPFGLAASSASLCGADALPTLRLALEQGASLSQSFPNGNPTSRADGPLALAAKHGNARGLALMLDNTWAPNRPARRSTRHGDLWQAEIDVALVMAVRHGHADAARALLERGGANPEVANSQEGLTPLMTAAKYGHLGA